MNQQRGSKYASFASHAYITYILLSYKIYIMSMPIYRLTNYSYFYTLMAPAAYVVDLKGGILGDRACVPNSRALQLCTIAK